MDYLQHRTDSVKEDGLIYQSGVGIRLVANFRANEGGVDLGSLFAIAAAARAKKVSGSMRFETLGVSGREISPLIPLPTEISVESIQAAMQSATAIKAKLYDKGTSIWPQIVAAKPIAEVTRQPEIRNGEKREVTKKKHKPTGPKK